MLSPGDWRDLILAAGGSPAPVVAQRFVQALPGTSKGALLACDDGHQYATKGEGIKKARPIEQIVGRLAVACEAPVPTVVLVSLTPAFVASQEGAWDIGAGLAHGSRFVLDCEDSDDVEHVACSENRQRFAQLAVFYGWFGAQDHQYLYEKATSRRVWSVDHGLFLPSTTWTEDSLTKASGARADRKIAHGAGLTRDELRAAASILAQAPDSIIATAVAAPPEAWGITMEERVALAVFLDQRREQLLQSCGLARS